MSDKTYPYDPDLPYVVTHGTLSVARFFNPEHAREFRESRRFKNDYRVVDTTPKPRVPEDATFITWTVGGLRYTAFRNILDSWNYAPAKSALLEDLPGVTPETIFTVLEERKS